MRSTRTTVSWILLAAMLMSVPGRATGHFVCTLGMAEAGPACPLCHGRASAEQPGLRVGNTCCKFVAGQPVAVSNLAPARVEQRALTQVPILPADAGLGLLVASDRNLIVRADQRTALRTRASAYLSNFLRL